MKIVFDAAMENGLNLWDTAFSYGVGTSEKMLGTFLKNQRGDFYVISDKLTSQCMSPESEALVKDMLDTELGLLGIDSLGINVIHFWEKVME